MHTGMGKSIALIVVAALLLLTLAVGGVGFIVFGAFGLSLGDVAKGTGQLPGSALAASSSCVSPLLPPIKDQAGFAKAINDYIAKNAPHSPFNGLGSDFVAAGVANSINPAWMVAIAQAESSLGTAGPPALQANNAFGLEAAKGQPGKTFTFSDGIARTFYAFSSFQASLPIEAAYLQRNYISQGLTTLEQIAVKYVKGPGWTGDPATLAYYYDPEKVTIGSIATMAGQALSCTDNGSVANPSPAT